MSACCSLLRSPGDFISTVFLRCMPRACDPREHNVPGEGGVVGAEVVRLKHASLVPAIRFGFFDVHKRDREGGEGGVANFFCEVLEVQAVIDSVMTTAPSHNGNFHLSHRSQLRGTLHVRCNITLLLNFTYSAQKKYPKNTTKLTNPMLRRPPRHAQMVKDLLLALPFY